MRKRKYTALCAAACVFLSGCGNEIPVMTQQQQNMVTEYAAGTLLKYSGNYHDKLIRRETVEELPESGDEELEAEIKEAVSDTPDRASGQEHPDGAQVAAEQADLSGVPVISSNGVNTAQAALPLEELLSQAPGFRIVYDQYEVCDAYSGAEEGTVAFEMTASPGKKLLVIRFRVTNASGQEQLFDVLSQNAKAKVALGGETHNALLTMLDNDLLTASSMMQPEESAVYVIVTQIDEDTEAAGGIVTVTCQGNSAQYQF